MEKAKYLSFMFRKTGPILTNRLEQLECSFDVCADKILRVVDRAVHMTLSRKMNDRPGLMEQQQSANQGRIIYIPMRENVAIIASDASQVGGISGVREFIQVYYARTFCPKPMQYEVGTDKTGPARH
jgi:hypothetical protein